MTNNIFAPFIRKSIVFKIFLITLILLIVSAVIIYSAIYAFLPWFYEKNKLNQLDKRIENLANDIEHHSLAEAKIFIDRLAQQMNVVIIVYDSNDTAIYISTLHSHWETKMNKPFILPYNGKEGTEINRLTNTYTRNIPVVLKDQTVTLNVSTTIQPIKEASQVLLLFIPYIATLILLISIIGAYAYSRIISRPLIYINQSAKKMAGLEFSTVIHYSSADEIGQLANSLNEMSANLQRSMNELRNANEQLNIKIIKEREIEDKRRELFAMISHELKSPLTAVKGQLEGMIHGIGAYKDRDKYLKRSYEILEIMEHLIQEILQIARMEQHTFLPKKETIDLSELICTTIKRADFFAEQKNIQIISEIEKDVFITSDKELIEKAIYNIIHNGVVHSEPGEKVIVKLIDSKDSRLCLTVLNTGVHIPEKLLPKIFDPFYRLERSRKRTKGGNGLGLYLVKRVFEVLSIDYSISNIEQGVLFSINFKRNN